MGEAGQAATDALDVRMEEADQIDRDEGDLLLAVSQDDGARRRGSWTPVALRLWPKPAM